MSQSLSTKAGQVQHASANAYLIRYDLSLMACHPTDRKPSVTASGHGTNPLSRDFRLSWSVCFWAVVVSG